MKRVIIVCAWLAAAVAASSCSGDGIGSARPFFDPFGTESAGASGTEAPGTDSGETLLDLCGRACSKIAACEAGGDPGCAAECAADLPPGCEAEYRLFVECIATAPICIEGSIDPTACTAAILAVSACDNATPTSGAPPR